jgi:hypothetical protein
VILPRRGIDSEAVVADSNVRYWPILLQKSAIREERRRRELWKPSPSIRFIGSGGLDAVSLTPTGVTRSIDLGLAEIGRPA